MEPTLLKARPAVKRHGGKSYLARRIIARFPPHRVYVEPFAGGLSCLLNKPPSPVEVASDLDAGLMHFYRVLTCQADAFLARLPDPGPTLEAFATCFRAASGTPTDEVDRAVKFLVRHRLSRGAMGRALAWADRARGKTHPDGPLPDLASSWRSIREALPGLADRLRGVDFRLALAVEVVRELDAPDALLYCDPSYLPATRTARKAYAHEMTEADHVELLEALSACRGSVVLSGYPSALYDDVLGGWGRIAFDMPNHAGQGRGKQRRTEVLWLKPDRSLTRRSARAQLVLPFAR